MRAWLDWSSTDYRISEQFEAWESALSDSHLPWSLDRTERIAFDGRLGLKDFGSFRVVNCECEPCAGRRSERTTRAADGYVGALLVLEGRERVRQDGHEMLLSDRSMILWDSARPIDFAIDSPMRKVTLFIPSERLGRVPSFRGRQGEVIDCRRGVPAVLASHMAALASQLGDIDGTAGVAAVDLTVELIAATLEAVAATELTTGQSQLVADIRAHIVDHLDDPELTPEAIARSFAISKRYLYLLFARSGSAVCQHITDQRLERARRLLSRPSAAQTSITQVAASVGLTDPAHFSRLFRERFGVAPREYRRLAGVRANA